MFPIIPVDSTKAEDIEYLGTKAKFWYRRDGRRTLFKAEERGTGEDWAEKVACELAAMLGLPHVHYELAHDTAQDRPGVICESFTPKPLSLAHGNQLLLAIDPAYPSEAPKYKVQAHTVQAVRDVVALLDPPMASWSGQLPKDAQTALDVFVGYIMLDAWIGNQDRHHQNWGAIFDGEFLSLAPSYDHASSMARQLRDEERHERLTTRDGNRQIPAFARKAHSGFNGTDGDQKRLLTTAAFWAFTGHAPRAASIWLDRLRAIEAGAVSAVLDKVPVERMSGVCRRFTLELLEENRRRLLAGPTDGE